MKQKFITTQDTHTATLLFQQGYQRVQNSNGIYVFLNTDKFQFSNDIDITKIQYSNTLTF
nr:MAG TPA: hypothetical protein [Caudoviricetes sp.]